MKKIFFGVQLMCAFIFTKADAQDLVLQTFYRERYGEATKDSTQARFVERTTIKRDGTTYVEEINLKKGIVLKKEIYNNGFQVGKWLENGKEYDFDFDVLYDHAISAEIPVLDINNKTLDGKKEPGLEVIETEKGDIYKFLSRNVRYPRMAREDGVQGEVGIQFVIDEKGSLSELSVCSGGEPMLDKEIVRVLRLVHNWKPARLNGNPVKVQTKLTTGFRLQE